jgi:hypothetical protein
MTGVIAASTVDTRKGGGDPVSTLCPVCPHPEEAHDEIALSYCGATVAGVWRRTCVCVGDVNTTPAG